ncbi:MAG: hypothetical protein Q9174_006884, partial [Haloplaca sp. 1 TL-2023]
GFANQNQSVGFTKRPQSQGFADRAHRPVPANQPRPNVVDPSNVLPINADSVEDVDSLETGVFHPIIIHAPRPEASNTTHPVQYQTPIQAPSSYLPLYFGPNFPILVPFPPVPSFPYQSPDFGGNDYHTPNSFVDESYYQSSGRYSGPADSGYDNDLGYETYVDTTTPLNPRALEGFLRPRVRIRDPQVYDSQWA